VSNCSFRTIQQGMLTFWRIARAVWHLFQVLRALWLRVVHADLETGERGGRPSCIEKRYMVA